MRIWIVTLVAITLGLWAVTESSDAQSTRQSQGNGSPSTVVPPGKIQIHLFGGDVSPAAPLAKWYRELGITDVWLYPLKGAFPQDQKP
ncbi:MAG: hypothetical protein IMZ61_06740, partial [Planctomycetes bacterium]|nr:hypothetical protein [Planctomycetota bacterium]